MGSEVAEEPAELAELAVQEASLRRQAVEVAEVAGVGGNLQDSRPRKGRQRNYGSQSVVGRLGSYCKRNKDR